MDLEGCDDDVCNTITPPPPTCCEGNSERYLSEVESDNCDSIKPAGGFRDPHFRTLQHYAYDFHGECDLVLLKSSLMDIHIRTKEMGGWSGISACAIHMKDADDDLLEIQLVGPENVRVFYHGQDLQDPDNIDIVVPLYDKYDFSLDEGIIHLPDNQYIAFGEFNKETFRIHVYLNFAYFPDAEGMIGEFLHRFQL